MSRSRTRILPLSLAGLSLAGLQLVGCAQMAFSPSFPDNRPADVRKAVSSLGKHELRPSNETGRPLAFMVTQKPSSIVAYDLEADKQLWAVETEVVTRVVVGKSLIFHGGPGRTLVARNVKDGQLAWKAALPEGERLLGVAADGDQAYYVTEIVRRTGGAGGQMVALGAGGSERWRHASSGRVGAPVARDGLVFAPLRSQSVAVLDGSTGHELARVRSKEEALQWTRAAPDSILFGGANGIYRLDEKAAAGTRAGANFLSANLPESVRPVYWWNGYNASLAGYTAYDRNRLLWRARAGTPLAFRDGMIFVHNYRFVFAFDVASGAKLRWAYSYPRHDAVASTYTGGAVLLVTDNGNVVALDPQTGAPVAEHSLKLTLRGATFDAAGYAPTGAGGKTTSLRDALKQVIWDPDRRFGSVKIFAVEQLAELSGPQVSDDLVKIVAKADIDRSVYQRAGDMIVARHDKGAIPLYLRTLKERYSFVDGTHARAVDIMARALGDLKAPDAVQPLLRHLGDHETPLEAVVEIVKALVAIGDRSALEPFRDFLLTYRCDPLFASRRAQNALNVIAEALLKMGGEEERQLLIFVENDVHTIAPLRTYIGKALREVKPERRGKRKKAASVDRRRASDG